MKVIPITAQKPTIVDFMYQNIRVTIGSYLKELLSKLHKSEKGHWGCIKIIFDMIWE